jgi:hypothetical protein
MTQALNNSTKAKKKKKKKKKMYLIIPAAPLLASAVAGLAGRYVGPTGASLITTSCLYFSLFLSCICFYEVGLCGSPCHIHALE